MFSTRGAGKVTAKRNVKKRGNISSGAIMVSIGSFERRNVDGMARRPEG